jgi:hypothetical protein
VIQSGQKALTSARDSIIQLRNTFSNNSNNNNNNNNKNDTNTPTADLAWYNKAQLDELNACARVCIANSLVFQQLTSILLKIASDKDYLLPQISFNFTYHHRQANVTLKYT